jgi:cation transport regulator ChaB
MFRKLAADALGLSDVGVIVPPADFNKVDADDYLFHEAGEKIYFLIKSKKDEYAFTNLGLVHVDGESAVSSKRTIRRYEFATNEIESVTLETAGTLDMDVELKFVLGAATFSIDVKKQFIEQLKDIYKALFTINKLQNRDETARENAYRVLQATAEMHKIAPNSEQQVINTFNAVLDNLNNTVLDRFTRRDFGAVFEKFIHN